MQQHRAYHFRRGQIMISSMLLLLLFNLCTFLVGVTDANLHHLPLNVHSQALSEKRLFALLPVLVLMLPRLISEFTFSAMG